MLFQYFWHGSINGNFGIAVCILSSKMDSKRASVVIVVFVIVIVVGGGGTSS